ncbi:hypothetical protein IH981_03730 [Patescibacteria group bacterium]|nr:hypothetical protein [Patescibacteria group bacterium]
MRRRKSLEFAKESSSTFDTHTLDTSESFGIGDIRKLKYNFSRKPFESTYQTFIILEAQNLTIEAQNALLKILEEPPGSAKIFLTAPTSEGLLSTIVSRCQKLELAFESDGTKGEELLKKFLNLNLYERYKMAAKLDIELWQSAWRKILLDSLIDRDIGNYKTSDTKKILNYIKLITKMRSLQKRRASTKLIRSLLLLSIPQISMPSGSH